MNTCPICNSKLHKVIYLGFPMKLCSNEECACGFGFFSFIPLPSFNGWFYIYEGSYIVALYKWLVGKP